MDSKGAARRRDVFDLKHAWLSPTAPAMTAGGGRGVAAAVLSVLQGRRGEQVRRGVSPSEVTRGTQVTEWGALHCGGGQGATLWM